MGRSRKYWICWMARIVTSLIYTEGRYNKYHLVDLKIRTKLNRVLRIERDIAYQCKKKT